MLYLVLQNGMTALMGACKGGRLSVVKELVNRGADIDATDNVSLLYMYMIASITNSSKHAALYAIHADIILKFIAMLYLFLQNGMTALMRACAGGHLPVVKELVDNRGADIDATDNVSLHMSL